MGQALVTALLAGRAQASPTAGAALDVAGVSLTSLAVLDSHPSTHPLLDLLLASNRDPMMRPLEPRARYAGVAADPPTARSYLKPPRPQMESARSTRAFVSAVTNEQSQLFTVDTRDASRSLPLHDLQALERSHHRGTALEIDFAAPPIGEVLKLTGIARGVPLGAGGLALGGALEHGGHLGSVTLGAGPSVMPMGLVLGGTF